eukprot:7204564-Pyramimonas_sp.AAC.1
MQVATFKMAAAGVVSFKDLLKLRGQAQWLQTVIAKGSDLSSHGEYQMRIWPPSSAQRPRGTVLGTSQRGLAGCSMRQLRAKGLSAAPPKWPHRRRPISGPGLASTAFLFSVFGLVVRGFLQKRMGPRTSFRSLLGHL